MSVPTITLTAQELELVREWFNSVEDMSPAYLEPADYDLADRICAALGRRAPSRRLLEKAGKL